MKKLFPVLSMLVIAGPALADSQFSVATGFDYSTGKYGNAVSTDILYIPVVAKYEADKVTVKLTVPYISITGPGGVIPGMGRVVASAGGVGFGMPGSGSGTTTSTNSGLGDVVLAAGYNVYAAGRVSVDVVGKIKFGTADAKKGLGTGENDYSAQVDGYYLLHEDTTLFATAGYKVVGAPPGLSANNVPYGTVGLNRKVSATNNVGVMLNVAQSAFAAGSNQQDVTVYASQKISGSLKIQENLLKGLADGSPDFGGGILITGTL